jgi:hypothetical protein
MEYFKGAISNINGWQKQAREASLASTPPYQSEEQGRDKTQNGAVTCAHICHLMKSDEGQRHMWLSIGKRAHKLSLIKYKIFQFLPKKSSSKAIPLIIISLCNNNK